MAAVGIFQTEFFDHFMIFGEQGRADHGFAAACAQAARQSNGAPRQKLALATTLVSKTTFTVCGGS